MILLSQMLTLSLVLSVLTLHGNAATYQDEWIFPRYPDQSSTMTLGMTSTIRWSANFYTWFEDGYTPAIDVTKADLWVCGFSQNQFQHLLLAEIAVNRSSGVDWTVQIPDSELQITDYWVLRFLPAGLSPSQTTQMISGPGFLIAGDSRSSSSVATSPQVLVPPTSRAISTSALNEQHISTASSVSGIASTLTTELSSTDPSSLSTTSINSASPSIPDNVDKGLIAGAVAGSVTGAAALIWIGWIVARRKMTHCDENSTPRTGSDGFHGAFLPRKMSMLNQQPPNMKPHELDANAPNRPYRYAEVSTRQIKSDNPRPGKLPAELSA